MLTPKGLWSMYEQKKRNNEKRGQTKITDFLI